MLKAGVIGLGQIGGGVAICLARADRLAAVYDVRPDASAKLDGVPAVVASPAEVAKVADVIMIAVVDADQARSALNGPTGILAGARPGFVVVLLSTVSLSALRDLDGIVKSAGGTLVDCGVTGGTAAATKGLVSLVGADDATFARVADVLNDFSKQVCHMGGPGAGMAAKIARNVIVYTVWRAGYEGAKLAEAAGIDVVKLAAAIDSSAENVGGPTVWMNRPATVADAGEKALRETVLNLLTKDLKAALALGEELGVNLPVAELTCTTGAHILGLEK
ncbi:MAG: oxidoreductase [Verrucomicrobiaceae bacterium]|nr:oxidoreductase [Verrucomicrobiaceae bacterium]